MHAALAKLSAILVAYGPVGILLLSLFDSAGVPLPAAIDLLLLDVAVHSTRSPGHAYFTALVALVGSLAGNIALFQGARHGRRLFGRAEPPPGQRRRFHDWFRRYGLLTVFVPAVVPIAPLPLKVFVISAGAFHTPFGKFVAVILAARVIRYFGMAWLALALGADAQDFFTHNGWTLTGIALALALLVVLAMRRGERGRQAAL